MITIRGLTYTYPQARQPALESIDWVVNDGEFVLIAGPSGSGKSTLLRCLNGLVPHFSGGSIAGEVNVYGVDTITAGPRMLSRTVGFVAQDPEAQAVLEVVESEIAYSLENAAMPPSEMRIRVEEVLELLNLSRLRRRRLSTLSGGERQKVAIAAALAWRPRVLVLDEPTSQLDPQSAEDVLRSLVRLNEDLGLTVVLAEHRLERILRYADRMTWLEGGRIVGDGQVRQVLQKIDAGPPLIKVARALVWTPLPLTVKEAKQLPSVAELVALPPAIIGTPTRRKVEEDILKVKDLRFAYNGQPTLKSVGLTVGRGEAVALLGRNGAGKSTLLKCIVGLLKPQAGEIHVNGYTTQGRSVADICLDVGYLPQNPDDLLFAESVDDEFRVTLRNHHLPEETGKIDIMRRQLGLNHMGDLYPRDLSVGQRQRVALGAVTITRPPLILLDEPTRGLDPALKEELVAIWRGWLDEGAAILLVTHDVELAAMIADRVVMMSQGEIIASGSTREILGNSPHFAPQMARLFPGRNWLTAADVLASVKKSEIGE